jgi:hypothetical protein
VWCNPGCPPSSASAKDFARPYDWTFTSAYHGTLSPALAPAPADVGIDYELLRQPERILLHDHIYLYAVRASGARTRRGVLSRFITLRTTLATTARVPCPSGWWVWLCV